MHEPSGSSPASSAAPVLVGVCPRQHPEVLRTAADLAAGLDRNLVCAYAVTGLDRSEWNTKAGIDFDALTEDQRRELGGTVIETLQHRLAEALAFSAMAWSLRILVGEPAEALGEFALSQGTWILVVGSPGTKRSPFRGSGLQRSTLARLLQHRQLPVLVVPPAHEASTPPGHLP